MASEVSVTIVPAAPGWAVLEPVMGEGEEWEKVVELSPAPVVAWRVLVERTLRGELCTTTVPVTLDPWGWEDDDFIIQQPDGTIVFPADCSCADEASALAHENERAERRRALRERLSKKKQAPVTSGA